MSSLTNIALSILDLAPVTDNGSFSDAFTRSVRLAQHVEQLGFTRIWLAEHHNMDGIGSSATAVLIGHIAAHTHSIRVGSGGIMLPNHSPLVIAEQFGTLASLYPSRIDLGIGRAPGSDGLTSRALRRHLDDGVDHFPENLAELQFYLGEGQQGQRVHAYPGRGTHIPIWLLGSSLYSAQLAARRGLPYSFASHFAPQMLEQAVSIYRQQFVPSAQLEKPYVSVGVSLCLADTDEQASFLHTTAQQSILALIRNQSLRQKCPIDPQTMNGLWNPAEQAYVNEFHRLAVVGDCDSSRQKLQKLQQLTQCDEFIFTTNYYDQADQLHALTLLKSLFS